MSEKNYPVIVLIDDANILICEKERIYKCIEEDDGYAVLDNQLALIKINKRLEAIENAIKIITS